MLAPLRIHDAQFGLCAKLKTGKMTPIAGSNLRLRIAIGSALFAHYILLRVYQVRLYGGTGY